MLYATVKTGIQVSLSDLAMHTLFDLLNYRAEVDAVALKGTDVKDVRKSAPMSLAEMTKSGNVRG